MKRFNFWKLLKIFENPMVHKTIPVICVYFVYSRE